MSQLIRIRDLFQDIEQVNNAMQAFKNMFKVAIDDIPVDRINVAAEEYVMSRSYNKYLGSRITNMIALQRLHTPELNEISKVIEVISNEGLYLNTKFYEKWKHLYTDLTETYSPLDDYEHNETRTENSTDTTDYGSDIETNGKVATNETTTRKSDNSSDIYGFNSSSPVGDSTSTTEISENVVGNADDNTTYSKQAKTGTDTRTRSYSETIEKSGRHASGAELLQKELDFRAQNIFWNVVYTDIDSVLTLPIY